MGETVIKNPFALTADTAGRGYLSFLWMNSVRQSLNLLTVTRSHNDRDGMAPKLSLIPFLRRNSFTKWCFSFISTLPPSFSSCLPTLSGRFITIWPKSLSADGWYPVTLGRSRSWQNYSDSCYDSNSRINGRLRPTPTPVLTPNPQPCLLCPGEQYHITIFSFPLHCILTSAIKCSIRSQTYQILHSFEVVAIEFSLFSFHKFMKQRASGVIM